MAAHRRISGAVEAPVVERQAFDHEGAFYSVRGGFVPRKGPHGADLAIRLGGQSGMALKVVGKHADVFELAAGSPDEVAQLMQRVRGAAAEHGRAGRLRFALPVRIHPDGRTGTPDHKAIELAGPPARIALALLPYAALGIEEFMIGGIDRPSDIARIGRETITLVANSLARREVEVPQPGILASQTFLEIHLR
ncbi:LLM class flavin-dependent oxidoreductase [Mesorhizobium sp. B3-1-3]|uniref:LLM class flavin-dependent oxidoreductase n=1 Tax=Mesorhizobium sp. B3-1-3 TaxID=2589896 RepID=UPI002484759C|nr:LLM class flavin-dependent oxidoreductase [Mesorhizobium sp. B3-1-3]